MGATIAVIVTSNFKNDLGQGVVADDPADQLVERSRCPIAAIPSHDE
jgi:hypothetical protein